MIPLRCLPRHCLTRAHVVRDYATSGDFRKERLERMDPHAKYGIHPWPQSNNPSPKEIFGFRDLNSPDFDKNIKRMYQNYVKIYHPDVSAKLPIHNAEGQLLSAELKRQRYDQIANAYNILRDPHRRHAYWRFENSTSNYSQSARSARPMTQLESSFQRFRQATANKKAHNYMNNEAFWQAATWEDYYRMRHKREPPSAEEIERSKYRILAAVLVVGFLLALLQYMLALKRTDNYYAEQALMNLQANNQIEDSKRNLNYGEEQPDRLKRFLLLRRFNYIDKGDVAMSARMKQEEEKILRAMEAQGRLVAQPARDYGI
jgi:hypothetical protein